MRKGKNKSSIGQVKSLMKSRELTEGLSKMIEKQRGDLGFLLSALKMRPRTFNPYVLKGMSIYSEPSALDRKTVELVAVGAAAALRCEHCLTAHINRALDEGATNDEVLDAVLISGAISESSTLSVALRKFKQQAGKTTKITGRGKRVK
ncbi:MAG: carboxymuconolactone decarboxylase family protein [Nitrospirae bacterium]|nr:carboxymuconolactone decarboxylase family protein [Nitrospirota bacterium]